MNLLKKRFKGALVLVAGLLASGVASAAPITMNFDGLTPGTAVHNYYDGGCSTFFGLTPNCDGPNYGVAWKGAVTDFSEGAPSPSRYMSLLPGDSLFRGSATMNVAAGFDGGLSFYYFNVVGPGSVSVYSGLNGLGTPLFSESLGLTSPWTPLSLTFSGMAQSVIFNGSPIFFTGFDNVTLGVNSAATPVPEPSALGVFGLGVLMMGLFAGLRRRFN